MIDAFGDLTFVDRILIIYGFNCVLFTVYELLHVSQVFESKQLITLMELFTRAHPSGV